MKRNLVQNLATRIKKLVSEQFHQQEIDNLRETLMRNGYPKAFIDANLHRNPPATTPDTETKRSVVLRIQFRGDAAAELFRKKVERALSANCVNTRLYTVFTSSALISTRTKDMPSVMISLNVIYRFT